MKLYTCSNCQNTLYFENSECLRCKHPVGFDPRHLCMVTLNPGAGDHGFRYCRNADYQVCNWLIPAESEAEFCTACAFNRIIPALHTDSNRLKWKLLEVAKHRLIYSLLRLDLPFETQRGRPESIFFDFMADIPDGRRVMTGHSNGVITINIAEADEVERTRNKQDLGERYRTLLGHFRHEIGHFYWDVLIRDDQDELLGYRRLFGDERYDYAGALETYYANGAPVRWMENFVSPYASAHPWEDWAETWAHYLHLMDTLETAWAYGIGIDAGGGIRAAMTSEPYSHPDFREIVSQWLSLSFAVNSLNRSMGHGDFYPFILSERVIDKLGFIHRLCGGRKTIGAMA